MHQLKMTENLATFVRTIGTQLIRGDKHFADDVYISPDASGQAASVFLTVDANGKVISRTTTEVAADIGLSGGGNYMVKAVYDADNDGVVDRAERIDVAVRNNSEFTILKGSVIYLNGAVGNRPTIALAKANSEITSSSTFGITVEDIPSNADSYVACLGTIHVLNTSSYTEGATLWLSPEVYGGMTTTKPLAPNHSVRIGIVTRSHPTLGSVVLQIQNGYEIDELHNVQITNPSDRQRLLYNSETTTWQNKTVEYIHTQGTASNTWTINHNLGKYPSVMVSDSAGTIVIGEVKYVTINQIIVYFSGTFSGKAYLN